MKKKICIATIVITVIIILVIIFYNNTHRSVSALLNQFEVAINSSDKDKLIKCYPDFLSKKIDSCVSEEKMTDFNETVGDIEVSNIKTVSTFDLSDVKELQSEIANEYSIDISIEDYQFITFSYHTDFDDSTMQVIKIKGKYYLYTGEAIQEPIGYFVE